MRSIAVFAIFCALAIVSRASLNGAQVITPEDYPYIGPIAPNNPPYCGMPYSSLNLNYITAVQDLSDGDCGQCIQVCNGSGACGYAYVVDKGGEGLDLSTGLFGQLFGQDGTPEWASWHQVDGSNCASYHW